MDAHSKEAVLKRLDQALAKSGKTDRGVSLEAGLGPDAIRDLRRRPKTMPTTDTLAALAGVLEIDPEYLAWGRRGSRDVKVEVAEALPIIGEVAAGLWLEIDGADQPEHPNYPVPFHPRYPQEAQYALIVRGTSMNKVAEPGDVLQCVDMAISGLEPADEDIVIVERRRAQAGQKEVTAKRFRRNGKKIELAPDSTDSRWNAPLVYDPRKVTDDEEVAVIAIVVGIYKPLMRRS